MYGQPGQHKAEFAMEDGWALFGVADGKIRFRLEVWSGQLVLRDTTDAQKVRWSGVLREQGQILHVDALEGENLTTLPEVRYREGLDMSQKLRVRPSGADGPARTFSLNLRRLLEAAQRGGEYVDL